jgi:hypothetical protein
MQFSGIDMRLLRSIEGALDAPQRRGDGGTRANDILLRKYRDNS